jgi:hypothetical protein
MLQAWHANPQQRPPFSSIVQSLETSSTAAPARLHIYAEELLATTGASAPSPPIPRRPAPQAVFPKAKALLNFDGQDESELSFAAGDILTILSKEGEWWRAESVDGRRGFAPRSYLDPM